ncbi:hypothetical protein PHISCL_04839 [Aspergillus sclerotialis]|uniref:Uncharacterized protein n=1 Tax=Aspergillus sclerotialis TaxID=2070753 RepID=A0A3A2ZJS0_9EURO|nr:hypothetical protein PHISCL_04839 [Aspergillus sclerotialis]
MSPQSDDPRTLYTTPPTAGSNTEPRPDPSNLNGGLDHRKDIQMAEDRMSGSLEGSTLGSSSRDGDRGGQGRGQRRTPSSGGFLLDSSFMPRSKSLRTGYHRPRRSEPDRREKEREKRAAPESEITVPKKKSFPWSWHKRESRGESHEAPASSSADARDVAPDESNAEHPAEEEQRESAPNIGTDQAATGLDKDSLHIVNLALNLSESRRRGNLGRSASSRVPAGKPVAYGDSHAQTYSGEVGQPQTRRPLSQVFPNDNARPLNPQQQQWMAREHRSVSNLLSEANDPDAVPVNISDSTLARAANARQHFELFAEYLRLLPSLPPLRSDMVGAADSTPLSNGTLSHTRSYNPLQSIRNRKIRFREKCPIDTDAEGWNNVEKVRQWVNDVEELSSHQSHSPVVCMKLPPFGKREDQDVAADVDMVGASPPASLRQISRNASSAKTPRPRFDWVISPAELLSDAAWVEEGQNKTKLIDKDGNHIYPDPSELVRGHSSLDAPSTQRRRYLMRDRLVNARAPRTPVSESRGSMNFDFKGVGRGRQRRRLSSPSGALRSSSASTKGIGVQRDRARMRSSSLSTASSMSDGYSPTRLNKSVDREKSPESHIPSFLGLTRHAPGKARHGDDRGDYIHSRTSLDAGLSLYQSKKGYARARPHEAKGSLSSGASIDDQYSPRMSLEAADTSPANSPAHAGYFPSITVNLSPPSSRSPSPSKKPFSRMIGPRHERMKSKHKQDGREYTQDNIAHAAALRKHDSPVSTGAIDHSGRLEPSPLPDRVSDAYQEDPSASDLHGPDNTGTQMSQPLQESKLRGFFKGGGKIAGIVGNEMSRVGDRILKKDPVGHSRKSSAAASDASGDSDVDDIEEAKSDKKSAQRTSLSPLPVFSEDRSLTSRRNSEKGAARPSDSSFLRSASPFRYDESKQVNTSELGSPRGRDRGPRDDEAHMGSPVASQRGKFDPHVSVHSPENGFAFSSLSHDKKRGQMRDPTAPFNLTRPPVTGLAQARASPGPSRGQNHRMSEASRSWSISDRSLTALADSGIPEKREIERTRALLLSSGIKAREINRRAQTVRDPPPEFLQSSVGPEESVPQVARIHEFDVAAQNLLKGFERSQHLFQQSIDRFPTSTSRPLRTQLNDLENLVNQSLSPRVRAVGDDAEDLSVQLHTTSTLAIKQVSDALDRGLRKRRRRLRWIRRAGFVVLEWALVGVLWWVWLIVMVFKLFRGVLRGAVSGIKWVLWL